MGDNSSSSKIQRCQRRSNHQILPSFKKNTTASAKLPMRSGSGHTQKFCTSGGTKFGPARTLCSSVWLPQGPIYWPHCRFLPTRKLFSGGNMGFILSYSLSAHPLYKANKEALSKVFLIPCDIIIYWIMYRIGDATSFSLPL